MDNAEIKCAVEEESNSDEESVDLMRESDSDSYDSDDYDFPQDSDTQNVTENYEDELEDDLQKENLAAKVKRAYKPRTKIPMHLKGLMGEANLQFARGEYDLAEKMCFEVIRQVPLAHEPYLTLANIHEGTPSKSIQYLTIAAHLNPQDSEQWSRLAQIHADTNNLRKAVTCYTRAIHSISRSNCNIELQLKRIELLEKLNDVNYIRKCKQKLLRTYDSSKVQEILQIAKEVATAYHKDKEYQKACEAVSVAFEKCSSDITPELVNIYLELLLLTDNHVKCLDVFVQYCNIEIEIIIGDDKKINVISFNMPENIPIDLRIKFIICIIQLKAFHLLDELLEPLLLEDNVDYIGDLYLDVAENLMLGKRYEYALKLLVPLIKSENFSLAAVWLKYAECQHACNMFNEAIESYYTVIKLAPQHYDVRFPLADMLIKQNKYQDALNVLTQDYTVSELHVALLVKRIHLLEEVGDFKTYVKAVEKLLLQHCYEVKNATEMQALFLEQFKDKIYRLKKLKAIKDEAVKLDEIKTLNEIPVDEEYEIFKDCLRYCFSKRDYVSLQKISFIVLSSHRFKIYTKELMHFAFFSCIYNNDFINGYTIIRSLLLKNPTSVLHLNLWNLMLQKIDESRHARFIVRQAKLLDETYSKILEANNALCAGSYKIATMILLPLLKKKPTPYVIFLTGIVFFQLSQRKGNAGSKKRMMIPTVYALMHSYKDKRGKAANHEVNYNLGRMYQKYGIMHLAAVHYKMVLEFEHPLIDEHPEILSLKEEAAYNLFLIYKESSNFFLARKVMRKYLVT